MRCNSIVGLTALVMLAAVTAGGARAEDKAPTYAYAKRMFAEKYAATGKSYACFARRYDAAHLAKHPRQKVQRMRLLVSAELVAEDNALNYAFALGVKLRDQKAAFSSSGDCGHPTASQESSDKLQLGCGADCDGGGLSVELIESDKAALVRVDSIRISPDSAKDEDHVSALDGADDKVFRLERVKLDECKPLMNDDDKDADKAATM